MHNELKKIKKYYGEEMMHFCRENFSTLFEEEGVVLSILENKFAHSHELFFDIKEEACEVQFFSAPNLKKYGTNVFKNNSSMKEEMQRICHSNRRKSKVKEKKRSLRR